MEPKFWRDRWAANQIGFHEDVFHPMLCRYWDCLAINRETTVVVPLCGKSKDLVWLRDRGHAVVGVELSEIAAQAFFDENEVSYKLDSTGAFSRYRGGGYTVLCGDIFDLTSELLGPVTAFYDRAALIALPPETRRDYALHLQSLFDQQTLGLLITVSYPVDEVSPPPFLVAAGEVRELYSPWCDVIELGESETSVKDVAGRETAFQLRVHQSDTQKVC